MTTSQRPSASVAFMVLRMKPRRWPHQMYVGLVPKSLASSVAILFSNPSCFSFDAGMLFGSAQTRNPPPAAAGFGGAGACPATSAEQASRRHRAIAPRRVTNTLGQREDGEHAALVAEAG